MPRRWMLVTATGSLVALGVTLAIVVSKGELTGSRINRGEGRSEEEEKPHPCRTTFEQVTKGMTREQVEATVGGPPGIYIHGELGRDVDLGPRGLGWSDYVQWVADDAELLVLFVDDRAFEFHIGDVWKRK